MPESKLFFKNEKPIINDRIKDLKIFYLLFQNNKMLSKKKKRIRIGINDFFPFMDGFDTINFQS